MLRWALFLYRLEVGRGLVIWAGVAPESARCDIIDTMQVKVTKKSGQLEATVQLCVDNQHRACHKPVSRPFAQLMTTPDVRTLVCTHTGMRSLSLGCQDLIHPMYSTSMTIVPNCLFIIRYSAQLDLTTLVRVRPTTARVSPLWWNTVLCQR